MPGVSVTFFTGAMRLLSRRYGDRLLGAQDQDRFNRFITLLAEAEATWQSLPPAEPLPPPTEGA